MIGVLVNDGNPSKIGTPVSQVLARPGVLTYSTVDAAQQSGKNVTQGNEKPPVWQGDTTTGRMAPEVPGGLHYELVALISSDQPLPLTEAQKRIS